jgi:hypothetical protein
MPVLLHHLARPVNLFTLAGGVFGPGFAIAAIVLAAANKHLPLAALSSVLAIVILVTPLVVFIFSFAKQECLAAARRKMI